VGDEKPWKVEEGVYGFAFDQGSHSLLYRSGCTKGEGGVMPRSCELRLVDLASPKAPAKTLIDGVYSFRSSEDGKRILYTMVRSDSDAYDTAEYNLVTAQRKTLDEHTAIPPQFVSAQGDRAVYLINFGARSGLYLAEGGV
jgi:hypothetical protein